MERGPRVRIRLIDTSSVQEEETNNDQVIVQHGLVQGSHARHVDSVHIDVDARPSQHGHDGLPICLLDALLKNNLVWKTNPSHSRVLPRKEGGSSRHLVFKLTTKGSQYSRTRDSATRASRFTIIMLLQLGQSLPHDCASSNSLQLGLDFS